MRLYVGLVHYPVYNKNAQVIASAITTLDLHDLARLSKTYGVKQCYVITPLVDQQSLAERVRRHWTEGYGADYNQDRKEAMELICVIESLTRAVTSIKERESESPLLIATDASKQKDRSLSYGAARKIIEGGRVVLLVFGTAWGLEKKVMGTADYILEPICGRTGYRHLSVRTAAAIVLDRLAGR